MKHTFFGKAFPDQLKKISFKHKHFVHKNNPQEWQEVMVEGIDDLAQTSLTSPWRRVMLASFLLIVFAALGFRLFNLQIVEGSVNRERSDGNRIKLKIIHAPRGVIYDRNGVLLAQNEPAFRLVEASGSSVNVQTISRDEALKMEADNDPHYNDLEVDSTRSYPFGSVTAHILGYMGQITQDELKEPAFKGYQIGDMVGRGGVEQTYENLLRGKDGAEIIEVDAQGTERRVLGETPAIPGKNLYLSIDINLQKLAYQQLENQIKSVKSCCGAVVAQDPRNGQILSLVSYPSFDPTNIASALTAANSPMLDRAISGEYPPGSTFKVVSSLAGLASGKITPSTQFDDTGIMNLGPYTFANWYYTEYGKKEGMVNLIKAIQRSNDTYYYHLSELSGEEIIAQYAKKLGLGSVLGIDLPGESTGVIPDAAWKKKNIGVDWYPGDTLHMAIGQGYVLATPLQINDMISTIADNGKQFPPHLAYKMTNPDGSLYKQFSFDPINQNELNLTDVNLVQQGLALVPKTGGTAWPLFSFSIPTAGKTGTAEYGDPQDKTHAWYTSYGPVPNPQISITAIVESGGEGSTVASPIAKELFRWYLSPDKNHLIKDGQPLSPDMKLMGE